MRPFIKPLILLIFLGLATSGTGNPADTLFIPQKVMDLPKVVEHSSDRAGKWGLPTLVALRYGLRVDENHDDRLDEEASELAALNYLSDLYQEFGDWNLCYYAYLYSPAYVKNLLKRNLSIPQPKPEITRPAPPKVEERAKAPQYIVYTVKSGDTLSKIAKKYHVKISEIKKWNNLKSDVIQINQKLKIYQ